MSFSHFENELREECYSLTEHTFIHKKPLLTTVDHGYIITMHNSTRNWQEELMSSVPFSYVTSVTNAGMTCKKAAIYRQKPMYDLLHAQLFTFHDAVKKGYKRILWMEDDVHFASEKNLDYEILNKAIDYYFDEEKPCVYNFGAIKLDGICPRLSKYNTYRGGFATASHAIVFNRKYMQLFLKRYRKNWYNIDWFHFLIPRCHVFVYKEPLAYQLIEETENFKEWTDPAFTKLVKEKKLDTSYEYWKPLFQESVERSKQICKQVPRITAIVAVAVVLLVAAVIILTSYLVVKRRGQKKRRTRTTRKQ